MDAFLVSAGIVGLAEMGDKTQVATAMLVARFPNWIAVVAGTTPGMMAANVPALFVWRVAVAILLPRRFASACGRLNKFS